MQIDSKSATPIYHQIVEGIRESIAAGIHQPGECLPSLRALAVKLGVNPNTVQRAYDMLEREGVLEARRGVGVFVTDSSQRSSQNVREQRVEKSLNMVVRKGLDDGVPVARMRSLFEHALTASRTRAKGRSE